MDNESYIHVAADPAPLTEKAFWCCTVILRWHVRHRKLLKTYYQITGFKLHCNSLITGLIK